MHVTICMKYALDIMLPMNCTIHGREIQFFCYITNSRIMEMKMALSDNQSLLYILMMLFLATIGGQLPIV